MDAQPQQNTSNLLCLPAEILVEIVKELRFINVPFSIKYPYAHSVHDISASY
jgi:hypothetical protein